MEQTGTVKAADQYGIDGSVEYVINILKDIDAGKEVYSDFISSQDVDDFCRLAGFERSWAGKTADDIANDDSSGDPPVVPAKEARIILNLLQAEIDKGTFVPKDGTRFNNDVLKDFLPKENGGLDHIWEYQFGLKVELEHGRTRGTNVTNNHPLLTGMIVMAHLTEDSLYYARLWAMEVSGEVFNLKLRLNKANQELDKAQKWLEKREAEKMS